MKDIPLVSAALDPASRTTMSGAQFQLALAMGQGWVTQNIGEVTPAMQQEWAAARAEREQYEQLLVGTIGQDGADMLRLYEMEPTAERKAAIRKRFPQVTQGLALRQAFAKKHKLYDQYYGGGSGAGSRWGGR